MHISIENCTRHDFETIFHLLTQLWPSRDLDYNRLNKVFVKGLEAQNQLYLKMVMDKKIIGFSAISFLNTLYGNGALCHIDEIVIDEGYRGKGLGKKFIEYISEIARSRGCETLELESALHRNDAHRFYDNLGFERMGLVFSKSL